MRKILIKVKIKKNMRLQNNELITTDKINLLNNNIQ